MRDQRAVWLAQAMLVTFLWSASKIIIKLGLGLVSPLVLIASIQTVSFLSILAYYALRRPRVKWSFNRQEIQALALVGVIGFVAAPLFSVVGLKYVTGTTAGLFAGLSAVLTMMLGVLILRERPRSQQLAGILLALIGVYVFLSNGVAGGSAFGMLMLLLAEASYALNTVLTRFVVRQPGDETMATSLIGSGIGMAILLPLGLFSGSGWGALGQWQVLLSVVAVGMIFGFAGMLWSAALDRLRALEAAIFENTMLIQIAILSIIFLGERPTVHNILGGAIVLAGAYLVDHRVRSLRHRTSAT